jgi:bacteriocin biosynthesis cyclodehydratase domain-containing protein
MLRLAPSHPPLWRTPSTLQFGTDDVARIDDVAPWQERVLLALRDGIADAMLVPLATGFGASECDARRFARLIRPALDAVDTAPVVATLELPADLAAGEAAAFTNALANTGVTVADVRAWPSGSAGTPVIVVAHRLLDPRRAARLAASDVVHLPVELFGDRVTVGPLIVPGRTACLACVHAHRTDADAQWPLLASQLLGRSPIATDPGLLLEAALLAGRLLQLPAAEPETTMSVVLSASTVRRTWSAHVPHARCLCRSPEGTASADAPDARSFAPTTATGSSRPA